MLCQECGKTFQYRSSFRKHLNSHAGTGKYHCCGRFFQDADHIRRHRAANHSGPTPHSCSECGRAYATAYQLREHQRAEKKEECFQCDVCDTSFSTKKLLKQHEATHAEAAQFNDEKNMYIYTENVLL